MRKPVDSVSVVAGVAVMALATLVLLDQVELLRLRFEYAAPAMLATVGVVLLAVGLGRRG